MFGENPSSSAPSNQEPQLEFEFLYNKEFFRKAAALVREKYFSGEMKKPRVAFYDFYKAEGRWNDSYQEMEDCFVRFAQEEFNVGTEAELIKILSLEKGDIRRDEILNQSLSEKDALSQSETNKKPAKTWDNAIAHRLPPEED